jgi:hypothetical protein
MCASRHMRERVNAEQSCPQAIVLCDRRAAFRHRSETSAAAAPAFAQAATPSITGAQPIDGGNWSVDVVLKANGRERRVAVDVRTSGKCRD